MKECEAIEYGKDYLNDLCNAACEVSDKHKDFVRISIQALEKQIPKRVMDIHKSVNDEEMAIYGEDARFGSCPVCGELVSSVWDESYCGDCGQKLDWSEE